MLTELTKVGIVEESTYGTTPASALQLINVTDVQMGRERSPQRPGVYTGDRRLFPTRLLQRNGTLTLPTILQYENMLLAHEGLFNSTRGSAIAISGTDISASGGVVTASATSMASILKGDWVYISGAGISPNTAKWVGPVTAIGALTFTVPSAQLSNFSAGGAVSIKTRRLLDGTTKKSYSAERQLTELTNQFESAKGIRFGQGVWTWEQGQFVTESFTGMCRDVVPGSATIGTGGPTAAKTSDYYTAVDDFNSLYVANGASGGIGAATTLIVTNITATINNSLAGVYGLGQAGPSNIDVGSLDGSQIQATVRFDDTARTAMLDLVHAHTTMAMAWEVDDVQGNRMLWFFPAMRPDSGDLSFGAPGSVVYLPVTFSSHDPAKDSSSVYLSTAFGFQHAIFYVPTMP